MVVHWNIGGAEFCFWVLEIGNWFPKDSVKICHKNCNQLPKYRQHYLGFWCPNWVCLTSKEIWPPFFFEGLIQRKFWLIMMIYYVRILPCIIEQLAPQQEKNYQIVRILANQLEVMVMAMKR